MRDDDTSFAVLRAPLTGAGVAADATMPCEIACVRMSCAIWPALSDAWIFFSRSRTSCAVGRKLRSFFRHCMTSWSSSGGTSGLSCSTGTGSWFRILASIACGEGASNGILPVAIS
jgi:hypothetical protein